MKELTDSQITKIIDKAFKDFKGQLTTLEAAIGTLYAGKKFGWRVIYLVHDKRTLKKYEDILDIDFREVFPETTPLSKKSLAWKATEKLSNFWKVVKGEVSITHRKEIE